MDYKYTSRSVDDTIRIAQDIESEKFPNMVICLEGDLGSGKTLFTKAFAKSMGIKIVCGIDWKNPFDPPHFQLV